MITKVVLALESPVSTSDGRYHLDAGNHSGFRVSRPNPNDVGRHQITYELATNDGGRIDVTDLVEAGAIEVSG